MELVRIIHVFPEKMAAVDMSEAALSVAQTNANIHHVASRSEFRKRYKMHINFSH